MTGSQYSRAAALGRARPVLALSMCARQGGGFWMELKGLYRSFLVIVEAK